MENYLLYGNLPSSSAHTLFKGRRKGSVAYAGVHRYLKANKTLVAQAVHLHHQLDHHNVLKFLEWYETRQHVWIVTELASGGTLSDVMDLDGPIPLENITPFFKDLASGLNYIHSMGLVYCNLHPSVVYLDTTGSLKLGEFIHTHRVNEEKWTIADLDQSLKECFSSMMKDEVMDVHELAASARRSSIPVQSLYPFYLAPEVLQSACFSFSSDLWSLGCLLLEMITGTSPFIAINPEELKHTVLHHDPLQGSVNQKEKLWGVIEGLLTKRVDKRWGWEILADHALLQP